MNNERFGRVVLVLLLVMLAGNVAFSVRQQRQITALENDLRKARQSQFAKRVAQGDVIDRIEVMDAKGKTRQLDTRGKDRRMVVMVNPDCASCLKTAAELRKAKPNIPAWIISVSDPVSTAKFAAEQKLGEVYALSPTNDHSVRRKLSGVPQVFVLTNGLVTRTCPDIATCSS